MWESGQSGLRFVNRPAAIGNNMFKRIAFAAVLLFSASDLRAQLKVSIVDVGQGDSIYIEFPNGTNTLIDGGSSGVLVNNFLKSKGVTKIDRVVLTHPHSDHYRGLKKVFEAYEVKSFYDTKAENRDAQGDNNLRELAAAEGAKTYYPEPDVTLNWDSKVTVKVLNSCYVPVIIHDNDETNNCSLVLRMYYNGNGIMFMGDANEEVESAMMNRYKSGLNSVILKVGHHGARTSSSAPFLERVHPKYAYISVGLGNVYGHPHKEALDRLRAIGAKILLTTAGTQSFTIPAPVKGQQGPGEPVIDTTNLAADQKFEDMTLTWTPEAPVGLDAPAASQLSDSAAK